jgi:hypothetical protein
MKAFGKPAGWENFAGYWVKAAQIARPPARRFLAKPLYFHN